MTTGKKISLWALAVVLMILLVLVVVIITFDWNRLKPTIEAQASGALHRDVSIDGDLSVDWEWPSPTQSWQRWIPWPRVQAQGLHIASPTDVTSADLISLDSLSITLSPLPLLDKDVVIPQIALGGGSVNLVRLLDGTNNWTFDTTSDAESSDATSTDSGGWRVDVGDIQFDPLSLSYDDDQLPANIDAKLQLLGKPIAVGALTTGNDDAANTQNTTESDLSYRFGWQAEGQYRGQSFSGSGKLGGPEALRQQRMPYPLQAKIQAGATKVSVQGAVTNPLAPTKIDVDLTFAGRNLGDLYNVIGVTLPDTPPYSTRGHLIADLDTQQPLTFSYQDFDGAVGDSDIHGNLTYRMGQPRPSLTGEVVSRQLRFADLAPLIGADGGGDDGSEAQPAQVDTDQPADKVLPVDEFQTDQWKAMDADVKFTAQRIEHGKSLPLRDLYTHVTLDDGEILLDPLRFGVAGGDLNTTLRLDGRQTPMQSRVDMHIRRLRLGQLFPDVDMMDESQGELNGDATLTGSGNSVASILGSSNGELRMIVSDGLISQNLMELAGLNVGNYLVGELFGDEQVKINCAAADFEVNDGKADSRFFLIDTENALIKIDGSADFGSEALNFTIEPESKGARILTLRSPLYVHGTFKNPSPGVDAGSLIARGAAGAILGTVAAPAAALLALVSPSTDEKTPCNDFLSQVQTQE
ncbi:AsmA family protein [Salinicola rhizosphaerae]|uniref:AsmA domain-containing protein n=1 Tax=Salinicola rhizosphaerae TaxID=1443141 RepID=A0ABQ3DZI0_9GAMM|nr:AsmA family protein [Salinicola rhizosphaerae]GHB14313.1 hypothetical protein GCM10009038_10810 [Salinicola rhizosphaerae]